MPSVSLSPENYDRTVKLKASHAFSSMSAAVGHALDDHDRMHVSVTPSPLPTPIPPTPVPPPSTALKHYVVLATPSDRRSGTTTILSPSGSYSIAQAMGLLTTLGPRMNEWMRQQNAGFQWDWQYFYVPLPQTLLELQTRPDGTLDNDEFGLGFVGTNVLLAVPAAEASFTLAKAIDAGKCRMTIILVGGGAWHGGSHNLGTRNIGYNLNGDDDFSPRITGKLDPTSAKTGIGFSTFKATSHEMLHHAGVYCHSSNTFSQPDHPADGGPYEPIDPGFTTYPLSWKYDDATGRAWTKEEIAADAGLAHHIGMERKLYAGQVAQARKYSGEWLAPG
jgi:hypothetical protein